MSTPIRWMDQAGRRIPAGYGDFETEYQALRETVGLIDIVADGRLEIGGKERSKFLNGLLSNYVAPLISGCGLPTLFLTAQGKVVAECRTYALDESFWIVSNVAASDIIRKKLFPLTYAGDFKVIDRAATHGAISLQGPLSGRLLAAATDLDTSGWTTSLTVDKVGGGTEEIRVLPAAHVNIGDTGAIVLRNPRTAADGYDLLIPESYVAACRERLERLAVEFKGCPVGWEALETARLEDAIPRFGADFDETVLAPEAGLREAISYHKGCYVGQETVAKIHWRGHDQVARRLVRLTVEGDALPEKGMMIFKGEKEVGWTTSAVRSPRFGKVLALGYVRSSVVHSPSPLTIKFDDSRTLSAELLDADIVS